MAYNIYIESYGCTANQNNGEIIKGILASRGFNIVENEKIADVIIINTCVVKGPTLKKMEARIKHFSSKKLIVAGCMPEAYAHIIKKIAPKASIVSVHHIKKIANAMKSVLEGKQVVFSGKSKEIKLNLPRIQKNKIIGIVQISQGCIHNCSYCIVRSVKGNLFSYPKEAILKDVATMLQRGCKEIWITSQDNACYGCDKGKHELPLLLEEILKLKGRFFVRLGMMHPSSLRPIIDEVLTCYKNEKMFKFLHLPVQSGSNRILKLMNRNYKVEDFLKLTEKFREKFPHGTLSTDIIVGYPGETREDFEKTMQLIEKIKPEILNISKFWPMPGTKACLAKRQIDESEKKERAIELMKLHMRICAEKNKKYIGQKLRVIVDSYKASWIGRTENYKLVAIKTQKKDLLGKFVDVIIENATPRYLVGSLC